MHAGLKYTRKLQAIMRLQTLRRVLQWRATVEGPSFTGNIFHWGELIRGNIR